MAADSLSPARLDVSLVCFSTEVGSPSPSLGPSSLSFGLKVGVCVPESSRLRLQRWVTVTWLLAGRGGERGGGGGGNNCATFPFFFFFLPLFSSPACLKLHTEVWLKGKRQREQDSRPRALVARARLSRNAHHGLGNPCPASSRQHSALCPSRPPPAPSHQCSTLAPGAKEELERCLNSQAIVALPELLVRSHSLVSAPPALRYLLLESVNPRAQPRRKHRDPPKGWFETNFTENLNPGFRQEGSQQSRECAE